MGMPWRGGILGEVRSLDQAGRSERQQWVQAVPEMLLVLRAQVCLVRTRWDIPPEDSSSGERMRKTLNVDHLCFGDICQCPSGK